MTASSFFLSEAGEAADVAAWLRARLPTGADLVADSRAVRPGSAFLAYPGERGDGRAHIERAVAAGAAAVVYEAEGAEPFGPPEVPHRAVAGLRRLAGSIASHWWAHPTERLSVIAVTGTNGKTSCSHWIAQLLAGAGRRCGVVGTLGAGEPGRLRPFGLTTPDAVTLQRTLAAFARDGLRAAAIEASSIGLHQHRLAGTRVKVAVFTNLTRDHLDYHGDMAAYAQVKSCLFASGTLQAAVVNLDDEAAATMLAPVQAGTRRIGFTLADHPAASPPRAALRVDATLRAVRVAPHACGTVVDVDGDFGRAEARLALVGRHNVQNVLAVLGSALAEGLDFEEAVDGLSRLAPVPGRLQTITAAGVPLAVVDYAHTPDALAQALAALAPVATARGGRLWCVFGAGGDRDPGKRPLMGEAASRLADEVVLASDNPRSEDPAEILSQIAHGMTRAPRHIETDRRLAIEAALREAHARDVVLIAGKGHEDYQEAAGVRTPFSDVEVARTALAALARPGARPPHESDDAPGSGARQENLHA